MAPGSSLQAVASDVNILFLNRCHESLSEAIQVEADATLMIQGRVTDPIPVYAVELKAPYKLAGLHKMDLERDVFE
ncbi:hypothetical protein BDV06DRAFT_223687 [Aspergillus oleicola]